MGYPLVIIHFHGILPIKPSSYWGTPMPQQPWQAPSPVPSAARLMEMVLAVQRDHRRPMLRPWRGSGTTQPALKMAIVK